MRTRSKLCHHCQASAETLFRCRYGNLGEWVFLCQTCLTVVKNTHADTYQYGGTWKRKKR